MKYILIIVLLFTVACTPNKETKDDDVKAQKALVGVWRGNGDFQHEDAGGWDQIWKIARHEDGTYEVDYLLLNNVTQEYAKFSDSGKWYYEKGGYYEINKKGEKFLFKVYSLKKDIFEYNNSEDGDEIKIQETKTVDSFQLQEPPEGYKKKTKDEAKD